MPPNDKGGHRCVGVAFQSLKDGETENIGYIIPAEVVIHFVNDYKKHKKYTGTLFVRLLAFQLPSAPSVKGQNPKP